MYRLCLPLPLIGLLAGGLTLLLGAFFLIQWKSGHGNVQIDGNERLLRYFAILALCTILGFLFFAFAWKPC